MRNYAQRPHAAEQNERCFIFLMLLGFGGCFMGPRMIFFLSPVAKCVSFFPPSSEGEELGIGCSQGGGF